MTSWASCNQGPGSCFSPRTTAGSFLELLSKLPRVYFLASELLGTECPPDFRSLGYHLLFPAVTVPIASHGPPRPGVFPMMLPGAFLRSFFILYGSPLLLVPFCDSLGPLIVCQGPTKPPLILVTRSPPLSRLRCFERSLVTIP